MPSSTTFVFIVSRFSAVLGVLQVFEKKAFTTVRAKKIWNQIAKNGKSDGNGTYIKIFLVKVLSYVLKSYRVVIFNFLQL